MTILNLMLGKKRGGLEQAALDYAEALSLAGLPALTVISPTAWVEAPLVAAGFAHQSLPNAGGWDILAAWRLRALASHCGAQAVICHGNRALRVALRALKGRIPIIAVAHNHATARFARADRCFAVSPHVAAHLEQHGAPAVTLIPNMVRLPQGVRPRTQLRTPPVIGSMGRFSSKKGFDTFVEALALLRARGVAFRAVLGGEGEQAVTLNAQIAAHGLGDVLSLPGWVGDKPAFFQQLDLFVLPSRQEAFGLVLAEAMAYGLPVIACDADGPRAILQHGRTGLLTPRNDAAAMADSIAALLADPARAAGLAAAGHAEVAQHYSPAAMAGRLHAALAPYMEKHDA